MFPSFRSALLAVPVDDDDGAVELVTGIREAGTDSDVDTSPVAEEAAADERLDAVGIDCIALVVPAPPAPAVVVVDGEASVVELGAVEPDCVAAMALNSELSTDRGAIP